MGEEQKEYFKIYRMYERFFKKKERAMRRLLDTDYSGVPNPITDWWIGMVRTTRLYIMKDQLEVGGIYYGRCRNASISLWNGEKFTYIRSKMGSEFPEEINHFEDDDGFDVFTPLFRLEEEDLQIPWLQDRVDKFKEYKCGKILVMPSKKN